ncbi:MAG TPA: PIN domain-containing protein [Thermoleophilaceae bacterium]|nr:PIN domain-containing protein [Actinomycetota bacterium]HYN52680.1 PIN domain-containing protein [Thermoleophilaceae bacterium]
MSRAIADTSVFIAREAGRPLRDLPDEIAVSVVTAAELELGVLRARDQPSRAARVATLSRVRAEYPLVEIDDAVASCFARIADAHLSSGRRLRRHDTWIAATALRHRVAVVTQDADFSAFSLVEVIRV